jgi:hypothetical protein
MGAAGMPINLKTSEAIQANVRKLAIDSENASLGAEAEYVLKLANDTAVLAAAVLSAYPGLFEIEQDRRYEAIGQAVTIARQLHAASFDQTYDAIASASLRFESERT